MYHQWWTFYWSKFLYSFIISSNRICSYTVGSLRVRTVYLHAQAEDPQNIIHFGVSDMVDSKGIWHTAKEANSGWLVAGIEVKKSCGPAQILSPCLSFSPLCSRRILNTFLSQHLYRCANTVFSCINSLTSLIFLRWDNLFYFLFKPSTFLDLNRPTMLYKMTD